MIMQPGELHELFEYWLLYERDLYTKALMEKEQHVQMALKVPVLLVEIDRYRKCIAFAAARTHDDDTHEFLNRVLIGKESEAPSYRMRMEEQG